MSSMRTGEPRARQSGFSVVELMVAITLSLFVLAGMGLTLANTTN